MLPHRRIQNGREVIPRRQLDADVTGNPARIDVYRFPSAWEGFRDFITAHQELFSRGIDEALSAPAKAASTILDHEATQAAGVLGVWQDQHER